MDVFVLVKGALEKSSLKQEDGGTVTQREGFGEEREQREIRKAYRPFGVY